MKEYLYSTECQPHKLNEIYTKNVILNELVPSLIRTLRHSLLEVQQMLLWNYRIQKDKVKGIAIQRKEKSEENVEK